MNRAYSVLNIKATSDEDGKRTFSGIATTPAPDRMGDIVDPEGAQFKLPIPLLWQHDSRQPIGWVTSAKVTPDGIEVEGEIANVQEAPLKERLLEAWQMLKNKLVRGLSIGFNPLEFTYLEDSYGMHFVKWEWLELSAVTIPANQEATITAIKSVDRSLRATSGRKLLPTSREPNQPRAKGAQMNVAEQIKLFESRRQAAAARQNDLMAKAAEEGRTLNETETQEYDDITADVTAIDQHLSRLRTLEKQQAAQQQAAAQSSVPVDGTGTQAAAQARAGVITVRSNLPKGVALAQVAKCLGRAQGNRFEALQIAQGDKSLDPRVVNVLKAAVAAGSTASGNWLEGLVGDETSVYADFLEFLRPQTILGKFGQNGVPDLRRVPFRVPLIGQTGGGEGYWVGEGQAKPLTSFSFDRRTLEPLKVANIAVVTEEALRSSSPAADQIIRDSLAAALRARLDTDFVDPAKAAVPGLSPASITNQIPSIASSGVDGDAVRTDLRALFGPFLAANNAPTSAVLIMGSTTAMALSLMTNPLGQPEFPDITVNGGRLRAIPVIVSDYLAGATAGGIVIMVNAQDIYVGDDGDFAIDVSREASLVMADDAQGTMDSTTPTPATTVSMFQTNSVAFRAERTINWALRRPNAVAVLTGVNWGAAA